MKPLLYLTILSLITPVFSQTTTGLPTIKPSAEDDNIEDILERGDKAKAAEVAKKAAEVKAKEAGPEKVTLHKIEPGGSLSAVSEEAYGRTRYWRILKLYNKVDPSKLQVGQVIKAPDIPWLIESSGLLAQYPKVVANILAAKKTLTEIEDKKADPTDEDLAEIKKAAALIAKAQTLLMKETPGVTGKPAATVKQLRTVHSNLLHIANKTKKGRAYHNSLAHEHLSNSIVYGVLWAQGGFK